MGRGGYVGVSSVAAGFAAASAVSATSTVVASFGSGFYNDSPLFLGHLSIADAQYHHHYCSLNSNSKLSLQTFSELKLHQESQRDC